MNVDITRLPLETAQRLMDHDPRVRQTVALASSTTSKQQSAHTGRLTDTQRADIRLDELHGVIDGQPRGDHTTRRVDVEVDILIWVFRFQEQQLGDHQVGHVVLNLPHQKNHPLLQKPGINVERSLASG